jgi:hypothetical protein
MTFMLVTESFWHRDRFKTFHEENLPTVFSFPRFSVPQGVEKSIVNSCVCYYCVDRRLGFEIPSVASSTTERPVLDKN